MAPAAVDEAMPESNSTTLPSPRVFDVLVNLNTLLHSLLGDPPSSDDVHVPQPANSRQTYVPIKDFPTEVIKVKHGLTDARRDLQGLPDADRSLQEQQAEIEKLERGVQRKKAMLTAVGQRVESAAVTSKTAVQGQAGA